MTEDQVRSVVKLLDRYNHPGILPRSKRDLANLLWSRYGVIVEHAPDASTSA